MCLNKHFISTSIDIIMKLFKPSLAILMVVSVLSDLIPAETSASITTHSQQYISAIQYISQYPNNWRMSQTDLFNTDTGFLVEVKTLWKQISKIPDSIQRAASYRTSLRDTIKRKTFDRLLLSKEASLFDLHRTQPWNIYKQRVSESLESIMARSNFIAKDILKFLFRLQENIKQMETLHINSDASSAFEDVCIVLEKAGYHYRSCYPQIEVLHTRHETVNISTTYVDIEGVRKNEVNQWSEIRKGRSIWRTERHST